jgi:hypothetical protein
MGSIIFSAIGGFVIGVWFGIILMALMVAASRNKPN